MTNEEKKMLNDARLRCAKELEEMEHSIGRMLTKKETLCFESGFFRGYSISLKTNIQELRKFIKKIMP